MQFKGLKWFLSTTLIFFCLITISSKTSSLAAKRPANILFILTDDLDTASVEYMPGLKSLLIERGISFSNYLVNVSLCCPSRSTTLRGQYAHNTKVYTNDRFHGSFYVFHRRGLEKSTIATWLQNKGYKTALIGKYLNNYPGIAGSHYVPPGWNKWSSPVGGDVYEEFNYTLNQNGKLVRYGDHPEDYGTDVYTRQAEAFITKTVQENKPFFVYLSYYAPHQPATPAPRHQHLFPEAIAPQPPSYNEADVKDKPEYIRQLPLLTPAWKNQIDSLYQRRLRSLQAVDEAIASLYETLKATEQLDNTYIFFASDNGFHLGQHRLPPGKETAYEEDIRVPLYVTGPGVPAGKTVSEIVANVDLAPTFATLAGANIPSFVDGRSFASLLSTNPPSLDSWRQVLLLEHKPDREDILQVPEYLGLRTANCTYVKYSNGESELYNLQHDPNQLQNLVTTVKPNIIRKFAQRLRQLRLCRGESCRVSDVKPLPPCDS